MLSSKIGQNEYRWDAKITRTDSTFDVNTRQIDVIAEVIDPFGNESDQPALKIGQFVSAQIQGRSVDDVFVIPNKSIREGSYIYAIEDESLTKRSIDILWQDDQNALVNSGISEGELVVTTSLNSTLAGAKAKYEQASLSTESALSPTAGSKQTTETKATESKAAESKVTETKSSEPALDNTTPAQEQAIFKDQLVEEEPPAGSAQLESSSASE